MTEPKVYYIKPRIGWSWVDKVMTNIINPIEVSLENFRRSGYKVVEKDGCTQDELLQIFSRADTYGVIVASHGNPLGISLDLPEEARKARQKAGTDDLWGDIFRPEEITVPVSPNLQFAVFFGCKISTYQLAEYAKKLGLPREKVWSTMAPGGDDYNFNLGRVVGKAYGGLSIHPRAPDAGVPMPKDAMPAGGVPRPMTSAGIPGVQSVWQKRPPMFQMQKLQEAMHRAQEIAQRRTQEEAHRSHELAQQRAQEAARRAQDIAKQREQEEAQRRSRDEAQRRREQAEREAQRQRQQREEEQRRRAQDEARQRERQELLRRQQASTAPRFGITNRPSIRPDFRPRPPEVPLPGGRPRYYYEAGKYFPLDYSHSTGHYYIDLNATRNPKRPFVLVQDPWRPRK
jgi:hypothetical protein